MTQENVDNWYGTLRGGIESFHDWHKESNLLHQALLIATWAGVMGLLAQIRVPLGAYPVPFTMQTFGVVLGAVLLGTRNGTIAQVAYGGAGIAGVPWFTSFNGGWSYFWTGYTAGYIVGFIIASYLVGLAVNALRVRGYWGLVGVMTMGVAVILLLGWTWLAYGVPALEIGFAGLGPYDAFIAGVAFFVPLDMMKVFLAAGIAIPFLPPARD